MIRRPDSVSGFVICITTAQLCVQKMKSCVKAHSTHTIKIKKEREERGITAAFFFFYYFRQITLLEN